MRDSLRATRHNDLFALAGRLATYSAATFLSSLYLFINNQTRLSRVCHEPSERSR